MKKGLNRCMDVCSDCERRAEVELCTHGCTIYMSGLMGRSRVKPLQIVEKNTSLQ